MNWLRLRIYQPQAHYRIPFTYQRRHTYPIPPYSTVIGFLCNVLGIDDQSKPEYQQLRKIKISIAGRFQNKTTEYIWFRNLSKAAHVNRFGFVDNRIVSGHVEHIGGQSPVLIDVLNDVRMTIYLAHKEEAFLNLVKSSLETPVRRLDVLHLGRAEDWIVIEELSEVFELSRLPVQRVGANFRHFFWIPENLFVNNAESGAARSFEGFDGLFYNVSSFWYIADYAQTRNRHGQRVFDYVKTKLNDGLIVNQPCLYDEELNLPIFLANFR